MSTVSYLPYMIEYMEPIGTIYPATVEYFDGLDCQQWRELSFWLGADGDTSLPPRELIVPETVTYEFPEVLDIEYIETGNTEFYSISAVWYFLGSSVKQKKELSFWLGIEAEKV